MTEQIKTWLVLFGGLLVGFLLVVLLIAVVPSSLLSKATFGPEVGRPKTTKQAQFSCSECGPRHHIPVSVSVPIRFRGA